MPDAPSPEGPAPSRIQHVPPGFETRLQPSLSGAPQAADAAAPQPPQPPAPPTSSPKIIRAIGESRRHEESWDRTPNTTGTGAIHVRTFHCKLTDEALIYLDQQINEWLDAHPQYEVKFSTTSVGEFTGKLKEPHLIVQVWV
ncbi:MAG TPA: hypothetical protein PKC43_04920 [Phycisphaerales bacterium]|mgnify:CR=1 FL=1|nr:hypothetical protein [Phycisphaerales bacterium]HMP36771.1 hypothetical protein [Phycisphaerales bacterium]